MGSVSGNVRDGNQEYNVRAGPDVEWEADEATATMPPAADTKLIE